MPWPGDLGKDRREAGVRHVQSQGYTMHIRNNAKEASILETPGKDVDDTWKL